MTSFLASKGTTCLNLASSIDLRSIWYLSLNNQTLTWLPFLPYFLKHYHIALEIALKMLKDARNHQWQAFMFSPRWAVEYIPAQNAYDPWIMRPTIHLFQDSSYSFIIVVKFMNLHSVNHPSFSWIFYMMICHRQRRCVEFAKGLANFIVLKQPHIARSSHPLLKVNHPK